MTKLSSEDMGSAKLSYAYFGDCLDPKFVYLWPFLLDPDSLINNDDPSVALDNQYQSSPRMSLINGILDQPLPDHSKKHKITVPPILIGRRLLSSFWMHPNLGQHFCAAWIPTICIGRNPHNPGKSIPRPSQEGGCHHRRKTFTPVFFAKPVPQGHNVCMYRVAFEANSADRLVREADGIVRGEKGEVWAD